MPPFFFFKQLGCGWVLLFFVCCSRGATTTGPDATPPPAICQNLGGGGCGQLGGGRLECGGGGVGWRVWGGGGRPEGVGFWCWFWLAPGLWSLAPVCLCTPELRHGNAERTVGTCRARPRASSLCLPALRAAYLDHWSSALPVCRSHLVMDLLTYRGRRRTELWWPIGGTPPPAMPPACAHGPLGLLPSRACPLLPRLYTCVTGGPH